VKIPSHTMSVWLASSTRDNRPGVTSEYYLVKHLHKRLPAGIKESEGNRYMVVRTETALPEASMWHLLPSALTCPSIPSTVQRAMRAELDRQGQPWREWEDRERGRHARYDSERERESTT
jgi:hypothetical protein